MAEQNPQPLSALVTASLQAQAVHQVIQALRATGQDGGEGWTPPDSVRGLLGRRLRSAGEPATQMLSTAAVLGSGCDADLLRAVSGRGEAETVEALDEAMARFLLIELPPASPSPFTGGRAAGWMTMGHALARNGRRTAPRARV